MALVERQLAQAAITAILATIYTVVPPVTKGIVQTIDICSTVAVVRTVRVHIVPPAGAAGAGNALIYDMAVAANGTLNYSGPLTMEVGGTIQVVASGLGLTITVSGLERTP